MTTNRIDIAAIRARLAAATSGPWTDRRVGMRGNGSPRSHEEQLCGPDDVAALIVTHCGSPEGHANVALTAHAPADLTALCDEVERLREIIAGRDRAPTDAEIEAHEAAGGSWLMHVYGADPRLLLSGALAIMWRDRMDGLDITIRWWPLDASGAPCAWPVVTEVTP